MCFFDFETVQVEQVSLIDSKPKEVQFVHQPILLCAQRVCNMCWLLHLDNRPTMCRDCRKYVFEGSDCVKDILFKRCHATVFKLFEIYAANYRYS